MSVVFHNRVTAAVTSYVSAGQARVGLIPTLLSEHSTEVKTLNDGKTKRCLKKALGMCAACTQPLPSLLKSQHSLRCAWVQLSLLATVSLIIALLH